MSLYEYVGSHPLGTVDPSGLYGADVHEDMTYLLAMAAGFCEKKDGYNPPLAIAAANQGQDKWEYKGLKYDALSLRTRIGWEYAMLADFWHLPGAYGGGLGEGRVDPSGSVTEQILEMLRNAAFKGGSSTTHISGYSRLPILFAWTGWIDTHAAQYRLSTFGAAGRTTVDINVRDTVDLPAVGNEFNNMSIGPQTGVSGQIAMLGVYLHSMQDSYAHVYGRTGHPHRRYTVDGRTEESTLFSTHADKPWMDQNAARQMAGKTWDDLSGFLKQNPAFYRGKPRLGKGEAMRLAAALLMAEKGLPEDKAIDAKRDAYNAFMREIKGVNSPKQWSGFVNVLPSPKEGYELFHEIWKLLQELQPS